MNENNLRKTIKTIDNKILYIIKNNITILKKGLGQFYLGRLESKNSQKEEQGYILSNIDILLIETIVINIKDKTIKILELGGGICQISIVLYILGYHNIVPTELNKDRLFVLKFLCTELKLDINFNYLYKNIWEIDWNYFNYVIAGNIGWFRDYDEKDIEYNKIVNYLQNNRKMIYLSLCNDDYIYNKIKNNKKIFTANLLGGFPIISVNIDNIKNIKTHPIHFIISENIDYNSINKYIKLVKEINYSNSYLIFENPLHIFNCNNLFDIPVGLLISDKFKEYYIDLLILLKKKINILFIIFTFDITNDKNINKINNLDNIYYKNNNKIISFNKNKIYTCYYCNKGYAFNEKGFLNPNMYIINNNFFVVDIFYNKNFNINDINNLNNIFYILNQNNNEYSCDIFNYKYLNINTDINYFNFIQTINNSNIKLIKNTSEIKLYLFDNINPGFGIYYPFQLFLNNLEEKIHKCKLLLDIKIDTPNKKSKLKIYTGIRWITSDTELTNNFQTIEFMEDFDFFKPSTYRIGFINIENNILYIKNILLELI